MTGSTAEAEDLIQDTWLRWQQTSHADVENPTAFLATTITRLALNHLQSARTRRESYLGPWLPEPIDSRSPLHQLEQTEALEWALLLLLESLTPAERAAYILHEAFQYSHAEIAGVLETTIDNSRQLLARARKHLIAEQPAKASRDEHQVLTDAFLAAARQGDLAQLEALFTPTVRSLSDGGGKVKAATNPVVGPHRVARLIAGFAHRFWPAVEVTPIEVNTLPALLATQDGNPVALIALETTPEGISQIFWLVNPDKLSRFSASSGPRL